MSTSLPPSSSTTTGVSGKVVVILSSFLLQITRFCFFKAKEVKLKAEKPFHLRCATVFLKCDCKRMSVCRQKLEFASFLRSLSDLSFHASDNGDIRKDSWKGLVCYRLIRDQFFIRISLSFGTPGFYRW